MKLKWLIPLIVLGMFTQAVGKIVILQPDWKFHNSVAPGGDFGIITGTVWDTTDSDSAVFVDTTNAADIFNFADDSINGGIVLITGGTGINQMRYIFDFALDAVACTAHIQPNWTTNPDSTSTYRIWYGFDEQDKSAYPKFGETYTGWFVDKDDTVYSVPIEWNPDLDDYQLTYMATVDSVEDGNLPTGAVTIDVQVWVEVSHDGTNWYTPLWADSLIVNSITDTRFNTFEVTLPKGTKEFRIGTMGGAGHTATFGMTWFRQWLWLPKVR